MHGRSRTKYVHCKHSQPSANRGVFVTQAAPSLSQSQWVLSGDLFHSAWHSSLAIYICTLLFRNFAISAHYIIPLNWEQSTPTWTSTYQKLCPAENCPVRCAFNIQLYENPQSEDSPAFVCLGQTIVEVARTKSILSLLECGEILFKLHHKLHNSRYYDKNLTDAHKIWVWTDVKISQLLGIRLKLPSSLLKKP